VDGAPARLDDLRQLLFVEPCVGSDQTGRRGQTELECRCRLPVLRAALITEFQRPLVLAEVDDPVVPERGVVLRVEATGVCMSDWHAWMGHEDLPGLPHVPGHEMVGVVAAVGSGVRDWEVGDRVTVPFSIGCGECRSCREGHLNTCDRAFTPGFSAWGSFAELVAIEHADMNLVRLPDDLDSVHAAALGCRFATAFRTLFDRARLQSGEWLCVYGCGGVGLSAVMIAVAIGARVVAVDVQPASLKMASELGADAVVDGSVVDPWRAVKELSDGGAHVSIDAVGRVEAAINSIRSLRKHGRHVQIGLMLGEHATPPIPMETVIMSELAILGTRGIPATDYDRVFDFMSSGSIDLGRLVTGTIDLDEVSPALESMGSFRGVGMTIIDSF
jgi:D-arabinose 1-dehydrogenase-like Zn-dependent alcohol dehydrogenase